jgi:hypothetical protein
MDGRVHLTENSAIRASTANFRRRCALPRTSKPVNEQDPWTLYQYSHGAYHFMGPSHRLRCNAGVCLPTHRNTDGAAWVRKNHQTLALEKEQVPQREDCMK